MWSSEEIIKSTTKRIEKAVDQAEKAVDSVLPQIHKTIDRAEKAADSMMPEIQKMEKKVKQYAEQYFGEDLKKSTSKSERYDAADSCDEEVSYVRKTSPSPKQVRIIMQTVHSLDIFNSEVNAALKDGFNFPMGISDIKTKNFNGQDYFYVVMKK
jgi:hypothetical protein